MKAKQQIVLQHVTFECHSQLRHTSKFTVALKQLSNVMLMCASNNCLCSGLLSVSYTLYTFSVCLWCIQSNPISACTALSVWCYSELFPPATPPHGAFGVSTVLNVAHIAISVMFCERLYAIWTSAEDMFD